MSRAFVCLLLLSAMISGQGSATFEVASIRPSSEQVAQVSAGMRIAGVALPPQALRLLDGANADPLSGALRAVGLTLESRKAPLEIIVVAAISKTPTEN